MQTQLDVLIEKNLEQWNKLRRQIHRFPETGYEEVKTTAVLKQFFLERGIEFREFEQITGGGVFIDANKEKTAAFRADIDALPLQEKTEVSFASCTDGIMHACGHDMHTAIAAALAHTLFQVKEQLTQNVLIFFQPAEECNPRGGSRSVMKQSFFKEHWPETVYGLHVWPSYAVGEIGIRSGALMGSSDRIFIDVYGRSAHAAEPNRGIDAIAISSELIQTLLFKLNREVDPFEGSVISVGEIHSGGRYNIICEKVHIEGTLRCVSEETRERMHRRIEECAHSIAGLYGGRAEVSVKKGYSVVQNDKKSTEAFIRFAKDHLGDEKVRTDINTSLIGEDFSFYSREIPSVFFFLGCQSKHPLHSSSFLPDERVLEQGVRLMSSYFLLP